MKLRLGDSFVSFLCPGCDDHHSIPLDRWSWNGDLNSPTLSPSISVTSGHYVRGWKPGDGCWCGKDYGFSCYRCHSFVESGKIRFLSDCTHKLANKTVDLFDV